NKEIEPAVAVIVAPGCASRPAAESDAGFFGNIDKGAVVIVVVEAVFAVVGDVNVGPAVVIVVGHGDAKAPAVVGDAGLIGDVGEGAVVIVGEEHGARERDILRLIRA